MRLGTRIFFCYFLILVACFSYPIHWVLDNLRTRYLEGVEDPLVDQANILAAIAGREMEAGQFDPDKWYAAFGEAGSRPLCSKIYHLVKTDVDARVYITDASGIVLFDSRDRQNVGADYSGWRDVRLTLEGEYGARTTADDKDDPDSKVLYVAAPVMVQGKTVGVLTVAKPTTSINNFLKNAKSRIFKVGVLSIAIAIVLSYFVSLWITRPIKRLTRYAEDVSQGRRVAFPRLDRSEIGRMGHAFAKMQEILEGKKYVEQYVQKLTHEVKSPLSAIRGAAELLEEQMPPEQRARFLSNIRREANRIQEIVDRMLELSALETRKIVHKMESISLLTLVKAVLESKQALLAKKNLRAVDRVPDHLLVKGDSFLLFQSIANLVQNAIDFSPPEGQITLTGRVEGKRLEFIVEDQGTGIPDFALDRIFEKFFSLQRPDSGEKSTGLGLNLVREVAVLHNGDIKLENLPQRGVRATLALPL